jgi:hypothetical protein
MAVSLSHFGAMLVFFSLSPGSLAFSKFHPSEKTLERAFRRRSAEMFSRALPLGLVEQDVRSAHRTVLKG